MPDVVMLSYLKWVDESDNVTRLANYNRYQDYYDGEHTLYVPERLLKALQTDFGRFIDNYCRRVVDIPVAFLSGADLGLEVSFSDELLRQIDDVEQRKAAAEEQRRRADDAERYLYQVYRDSGLLRRNLIKALRIQGKKGELAFKVVLEGDKSEDGKLVRNENLHIKVKVLRPDIVFPKWCAEDYEVMESCVIKYTRTNAAGKPEVFAQVWDTETVREYVSTSERGAMWQLVKDDPNPYGVIPIVWCKNREDDLVWGRSDLEDIIPLQDALNKTLVDLMYVADLQAFQRIWLLGRTPNKEDQINSGPGVVNSVSDKDAKMTVVEPVDPKGLLDIMERIVEEISALSGIPQRMFNKGEGFGQLSGVALKIAFMPLIDLANEKAALMRDALERVNQIIFTIAATESLAGGADYTDLETAVALEEGLPVDERETTEVVSKQVDGGLKSRQTAMKEIGVEDVEAELERIAAEREELEDPFTAKALADIEAEGIKV